MSLELGRNSAPVSDDNRFSNNDAPSAQETKTASGRHGQTCPASVRPTAWRYAAGRPSRKSEAMRRRYGGAMAGVEDEGRCARGTRAPA
ncbi:MAG: hypothetical protein WC683_20660, partial [bacterium]